VIEEKVFAILTYSNPFAPRGLLGEDTKYNYMLVL